METQHHRAFVLRAEAVAHDVGPEAPRRAELRDLLEEIAVAVEKESETRGEVVDVQYALDTGLHVGDAIGQREGDLLGGGASRLAHVITADADRVPVRHFLRAKFDNVGNEAQGRFWRKD